ncbi:uracil-DNA glycosylase family protein [Shewanella decolorationis]|nr:uracil-DNA glycosylase family protein [Shewanella decolorationis]
MPPKPILQASSQARILIAGQAPGVKTHHKGIPFDDASGERLRVWLNVSREQFYDPARFAIVPMGFCFPGTIERNGKKQGDKPPRPECAATWHERLLALMPQIELVLVLGQYAIEYHLHSKMTVTQACEQWQHYWPNVIVLPHPSPRNNLWLKQHPEFERVLIPKIRSRIAALLNS